jgi:hypothetical protein
MRSSSGAAPPFIAVISPPGDGRAPRWPGAAEPKTGAGIAESRCEPGGNGRAHAQASKAVLRVDRT